MSTHILVLMDRFYLRPQWRDEADTLQLGSTDEYFETVEYEPDRSLEHRDILQKPPNLKIFEFLPEGHFVWATLLKAHIRQHRCEIC